MYGSYFVSATNYVYMHTCVFVCKYQVSILRDREEKCRRTKPIQRLKTAIKCEVQVFITPHEFLQPSAISWTISPDVCKKCKTVEILPRNIISVDNFNTSTIIDDTGWRILFCL